MKAKHFIPFLALGLVSSGVSQTYSDDFESYSSGDYMGSSNSNWSTWGNAPGTAEDVQVTNTKANSGSNSIYFETTADGGGPQDVILEFGDEYNTGQFELEFSMFVESGHGAYFNLQGTETPGTTWHSSFQFLETGMFTASSTDFIIGGSYPTNQWFDIRLEGNLNLSQWEMFIDDSSVGKFSTSQIAIASMNIYPVNGSAQGGNGSAKYWLDDVSYTYTSYTLPSDNAGMMSVIMDDGVVGLSKPPSVMVRNLGTNSINAVEVEFDYNGSSFTETFNLSTELSSLEVVTLDATQSIDLVEGPEDLTATIQTISGTVDNMTDDNSAIVTLNPIVPADGKMVVVEEGTGTWCGWCPRGAVFMERAESTYEQYFQGIAVHNGDPMTNSIYDGGMGTLISGYPSALVMRGGDIDPSAILDPIAASLQIAPKGLLVNGAQYDDQTNVLEVSIEVNLEENINSSWKIACAIVENGVTGTGTNFGQSNYYAGGDNGEMGGYESLPGTVPAADMVYEEVARAIMPNFAGYLGFDDVNTMGGSKIFNFSFAMDADWNMDEMHIVGLFISDNGSIDNASSTTIDEAIDHGFQEGKVVLGLEDNELSQIEAWYNKTNKSLDITLSEQLGDENIQLNLIDALGRQVLSTSTQHSSFVQIKDLNLSSGLYTVQFVSENTQFSHKFMVY